MAEHTARSFFNLSGDAAIIEEAIHYLNEQDVQTEVIGND